MKVNEIPVKQNANQVTDPSTQVSAEEFNALVANAKESVTSMEVLAGQEEVKLSYGKGKGTSSALTFPTATAAGAGMMSPKQAARIADRTATDGMGYVVLDKDKTFAEQVTQENTIYEIRYEFDLGRETIPIPKKCIFKFEGGSIGNGTIKMNDTSAYDYDTLEIVAPAYHIFKDNLEIIGEFTSDRISIEWFGAVGDGKTDCTEAFRYAIKTLNATLYDKKYYGKNYAVHLNANRTYVVTGALNHYDGKDHDVYSISFVGEKYAQSESYQTHATRGGGIQVNTSNVPLFANANIQNVAFINVYVQGLWINWVADNVRFFDNCDITRLLICNCYIQYIYTMFYNSGVHGVSRIYDNTFLGVYNFSYHEDGIDWQKRQLVDTSIYGNYINGGAPGEDKVPEIDNYFCTWATINGSDIHHNFIDFYATVYDHSLSFGNINSNHNHYQVFRYFHLTAKIHSINDYFNWNDPEADSIKDVFARFKVKTLNGNDGITYDIPPYIATDRYIDEGDTVFKDMILEENIVNVIMRRGGTSTNKGSKFIVELHEHSYTRNNAIVKAGGFQQVNGQTSVYLNTLTSQEISIDKRLAHVVETLPAQNEIVSGACGLYGIGEYVKCGNQYYKMKVFWNGNSVTGYGLVKENPDFVGLGMEGVLTYVNSNKFTVYSKTCFISTKYAAGNEAKYKVESFTIPEALTSEIVTFYFDGLIVFNNLKNRYGSALTLSSGDSLSVMRDINDKIIVIGYYCAAENNTTGLTTARPTSPSTGQLYFDTTLGKPIWWNGSAWVDVTGATV